MKLRFQLVMGLMCLLLLSGCWDRINLEDQSLVLIVGVDLDEQDNLIFYVVSPVFSPEAKEKLERVEAKAKSFRASRAKFDSTLAGLTVGGKIQAILLGKRLLQYADWPSLLDVFYRDAKLTVNPRMLVVDGSVKEVIEFQSPDKPPLPLYLSEVIDTGDRRNIIQKTTLQHFHRQLREKGETPAIPEIRVDKNKLELYGTALLDNKGRYATSLALQDNTLLKLLKGEVNDMNLTFAGPEAVHGEQRNDAISMLLPRADRKVKIAYRGGRFHSVISMDLTMMILERTFDKGDWNLQEYIEKELEKELNRLLEQCQKNHVDPIGLGIYARAHAYPQWKKVEDDWPSAFSDAIIEIHPKVKVDSIGIMQ